MMSIEEFLKKYKVINVNDIVIVDCGEDGDSTYCLKCPVHKHLETRRTKCHQIYRKLEKQQKIKEILK